MTDGVAFEDRIFRLAEAAPDVLTRTLCTGGVYADLFYECTIHHRQTWQQVVRAGALEPPRQQGDRQVVEGAAVHVLGREEQGFGTTDDLARSALIAAADAAAGQIDAGRPMHACAPLEPLRFLSELPADAPDAVAASEKTALVQAAAEAAFALDDRVRRVEVGYHDRVRRILVATTDGVLHADASLLMGLRVNVTMHDDGEVITASAVAGGPWGIGRFFEERPEQVARAAVERAQQLTEAEPVRARTLPVVLAGGWGGVWLHEAVGHGLEADTVMRGASPFAGHHGEAVAAPSVTLVDDATQPGARATCVFDDEGTPAERTVLIEDGVLRGLLTDRCHALWMELPRTGNGRRQDYRHPSLPRMTNLLLCAGPEDPADLIADVHEGLYVTAVGHGVVQPNGDFSFDVLEGYRIENGRCAVPVRQARITGNGPAMLRAIAGVGCDVQIDAARGLCRKAGQTVPVSVGMPTVLIRDMQVADWR